MADQNYRNLNPKYDDTRYKINNSILRMMNTNPALGTGYIIGSMLGENYWGKKRAKSFKEGDRKGRGEDGPVGADANGTYGTDNNNVKKEAEGSVGSMSPMERRAQIINDMRNYLSSQGKTSGVVKPSDVAAWKGRNEALQEYMQGNPNGKVLYGGYRDLMGSSSVPTPQQANKPAVTTENAGNGGGVPTPADHWNNIMNASTYNPGSTGMYTNGARNLGNVIGADANGVYGVNSAPVIGADANGVYGVAPAGAAPSVANFPQKPANGPAPYTDDQLRQIQGQNFTAEELAKMASPQELARMVVMARGGAAPAGGGVLTSAAERYAPATPAAPAAPQAPANIDKIIAGDDEIYERGNPFAGQSTPLPVSHRPTLAMAAAWQQDPNIMNVASSTPTPQLVYPNDVDPRYLALEKNLQVGDM